MSTSKIERKALVKTDFNDSPLWIYFNGRIQCFKCGWWNKENDNLEKDKAVKLWESHICEGEV